MQDENNLDPYQTPRADVGHSYEEVVYDDSGIFSLKGRIGRLRYVAFGLVFALITLVPAMVIGGIVAGFMQGQEVAGALLMGLIGIAYFAVIIYSVIIGVRRLHDLNMSGWMWLINLIPLIGTFFALYMLFAPGKEDENDYGNPPAPNPMWVTVVGWGSLLVIPAIGILAAIAVPAYQDYVNRAKAAQAGFEQSMEGMENMDIESDADAEAMLEELMREMEGGDADAAGAAIDGAADATADAIQDGATELGGAMSDAELDKLLQELESNDGQGAEVVDGAVDGTVNDNMLLDGGAEMSQEEAKKELEKLLKELEQAENELQNQPQ